MPRRAETVGHHPSRCGRGHQQSEDQDVADGLQRDDDRDGDQQVDKQVPGRDPQPESGRSFPVQRHGDEPALRGQRYTNKHRADPADQRHVAVADAEDLTEQKRGEITGVTPWGAC
jgi:hypothetical protein